MFLQESNNIKYSALIYYSKEIIDADLRKIKELLLDGKKIILLLNKSVKFNDSYQSELKDFFKSKLIQVYSSDNIIKFKDLYIIDGFYTKEQEDHLKEILRFIPQFNYEQYKAEHLREDCNVAIEAGAGTGKTKVMIDRIMYLLHMKENLSLKNIVMITFTREATQNMRHRLQKELLVRYKLTRKEKYLNYLEDESQMKIQTIPAFAKYLISEVGAIVGYGKDVRIKSFIQERKELINEVLDDYFNKNIKNSVRSTLKTPLHEFIKTVDTFWNKLENEGIGCNEIESFDWGKELDKDSKHIHAIFKEVFGKLELEFQNTKRKENAISLKDLARELDDIKSNLNLLEEKIDTIKYLFIDEFQDTDSTQIDLVVWLQKELKTKVFVVGDIKQSIYRFRGATYTAFNELKQRLDEKIEEVSLVKNYRTSSDILNAVHPLFQMWNSQDLLPYAKKDMLQPMNTECGSYNISLSSRKNTEINKKAIEIIQNARAELDTYLENKKKNNNESKDENKREQHEKVAVLVRTNYQAENIKELCQENGIPCYVEVGGTFFTSKAVRDFFSLISAYLYPNEPIYKLNLLASPYSKSCIGWRTIWNQNGDKEKINKILDEKLLGDGWDTYKQKFRLQPALSVIRELIEEGNPIGNFYELRKIELTKAFDYSKEKVEEQANIDAIQYNKNLNHLMELLRNKFSQDFVSLYKIHNFLKIQISTNREEDEVRLEEDDIGDSVHCMTVHKSKGLEFDTVIIPFTNKEFRKEMQTEMLIDKRDEVSKIGWNIWDDKEEKIYRNDYYENLEKQEKTETSKEETRLLYVALTRAVRKLICIKCERTKNTWSNLL